MTAIIDACVLYSAQEFEDGEIDFYCSRPEVRHSRSRERGRPGRFCASESPARLETERMPYGREQYLEPGRTAGGAKAKRAGA